MAALEAAIQPIHATAAWHEAWMIGRGLAAFRDSLLLFSTDMDPWKPLMEDLEAAIAAVVEGDVNRLSTVMTADHLELLDAAAKLSPLSVSRSALTRVLKEWRSGHCSADDVQQWASFVRRGYVSGRPYDGLRRIDIEYDAIDEELIVEIIGRLDEIGDLIDGRIDDNEQEEMLRALQE